MIPGSSKESNNSIYERVVTPDGHDSLSRIARLIQPCSRVLDIGAGTGALGKYLSAQKQCVVDGIEIDPEKAEIARPWYRKLVVGDVESMDLVDRFARYDYEYIVCADVLEHLRDPGKVLSQLPSLLAENGRTLLSIPNIGHAGIIASLIKGEFPYRPDGLLDVTHLRFFTRKSLFGLLREHGFSVLSFSRVTADLRETEFREHYLDTLPENLYKTILAQPDALTYQFIVEAMPGSHPEAFEEFPEQKLRFGCQIFWRTGDVPYSYERCAIAGGVIGEERQVVSLLVPPMEQAATAIRLDLADRPGFLHLHSMQLRGRDGEMLWVWDGDMASLMCRPHQQILFLDPANTENQLLLTGCDPHVELPIPIESLRDLKRGGVLEMGIGWPLSSDFVAALKWFGNQKYLRYEPRLQGEVDRLQADNQRLQGELDHAFVAITQSEATRQLMLASSSWRLTAPLRALSRFLRWLYRQFVTKFRSLSFVKEAGFREVYPEQNLAGSLDAPCPSGIVMQDLATVSGWVFSKDAPIKSLRLKIGNLPETALTYGYARQDVAQNYPEFPAAATSGFGGIFVPDRSQRGWVVIEISAILRDGRRVKCFTRRIKIGTRAVSGGLSFLPQFLYSAARKGWRAFREGRLPISLSLWIKHFHRHYDLMLVNSQAARFQNDPARSHYSMDPYLRWIDTNRLTVKLVARMKVDAERLRVTGPIISIIVPVYNTPRVFLEEMIDSVISQIYPKWELCLADDASTQPHVREVLEKMAAKDDRIRIIYRSRNGHIVEATNSALGIASGEYVVLLDHDDVLPPDAILHIAECITRNPHVDWIYTDEDKIDKNGRHFDPQFKGGWNPEMAITHNFTHHLTAIRKSLVERVGGMRKGFEGAQDLDLFLRVAENTTADRIRHVPHVCYHWRSHGGSTASHGTQKSYIFDSAYRAINDALKRRALRAEPFLPPVAERHGMCLYQLKWHADLSATRKVTIVIPTKDRIDLLKRCISSLQKTVDDRFVKLLIVDDRSSEPRTLEYLGELEHEHVLQCRVIHPETNDEKFNYARLMNEAARHIDTPYMLQLNNDVEAIKPGWLEEMLGWMSIDNVAVVGARLLYPDGKIQHGGVVVGPRGGLADHQFHLLPQDEVGYLALPHAARNVSAVTGACMLTSTDLYRELNGFDENNLAVEYNDVDFCLRVIAKGKRIVYTPQATLLHLTSASRGMDYNPSEHINFVQRYHKFRDPFFNENIQIDSMRMTIDPRHFVHADRIGKLKVLLITHNLNLGGAPIVAYEFAKHFVTHGGYQVSLISPEDGPLRERYEALNIPIHILHDFPLLQETNAAELQSYLKTLGDLIDVGSFDLVVCNTLTTFWGLEMARMFNVPSIWHIHESTRIEVYNVFFEKSVRPLLCSCFMNANRVVFQAEATRRLFHDIEARGNFCTIPGGVPLERINAFRASHGKKRMRAKYGIDENCTVVTLIGTTCERKGQHVFLEAIQKLEKEYPDGLPDDLVFIMVGAIKGPYLDFLHERRKELGLDKVRIFDETKEIYDFYVLSDIFVCASFEESFPMVVLLAMAFELKIVSTDVFGIPEIISDGQDGRLVKPGDPAALGNAIYVCLNNPELSDRMARNAYAKVYRLFDNDKFLERHLLLTKEVSVEECAGAGFVATASEYAQPVSASVS
ncbi:MAG: glycosyltransferase [Gammaproteobacteria bacterium]|nr:MAG: glycosyltransferase [Gammaproteobacteria bacterium]